VELEEEKEVAKWRILTAVRIVSGFGQVFSHWGRDLGIDYLPAKEGMYSAPGPPWPFKSVHRYKTHHS
jgi:hypothetical protein